MATIDQVVSQFQSEWGYVPQRFLDMQDDPTPPTFNDSYLGWIADNVPDSGSGGSTSSGSTTTSSSSTSSGSEVTEESVRALFERYNVPIATTVETEEQRLARIVGSGRPLSEIENSIQRIAAGEVTFNPDAPKEFGGTGGTGTTSTVDVQNQMNQAPGTYSDRVGIDKVREALQASWGGAEVHPTTGETLEAAAARIAEQVNSGQRSWANVTYWLDWNAENLGATPFQGGIEALPQGSHLVKVGSEYRVIWSLGPGLGFAWYSISSDRVQQLYGTAAPTPEEFFNNHSSFTSRYGDNFWGDVTEIVQTAQDPWQDMQQRIFNQFGYVAGMDTAEVKQLLLQAWFEGWSPEEFVVHYKGTNYFNSLSNLQREWAGLSEAEKEFRIQDQASKMAETYRRLWGTAPPGGIDGLRDAATAVASGQMSLDEWEYRTRQEAITSEGTPAYLEALELERAGGEPEVNRENLGAYAEQQWREWVGPYQMPTDFAARWGDDLYMNRKSQADLESYLKSISQSYWQNKPSDVTWADWSAPVQGQIQNLLEVPTLDPNDPLLADALTQGLMGRELTDFIRQDPRYLTTNRMYNDLSRNVSEIGRIFGFVS